MRHHITIPFSMLTNRAGSPLGLVGAVMILAMGVAACGGTTKTTATRAAAPQPTATGSAAETGAANGTATITKAKAATAYSADVAPANAAIAKLQDEFNATTASTTASQLADDAKPVVAAIARLNGQLSSLAASYPPAGAGLKGLISAATRVSNDFASLDLLTKGNASAYGLRIREDLVLLARAVAVVRKDLGLA